MYLYSKCVIVQCSSIAFCNLISQSGFQPIHLAAKYGQIEMLRLLVQKYHVDPNTPVIVSAFSIMHACIEQVP